MYCRKQKYFYCNGSLIHSEQFIFALLRLLNCVRHILQVSIFVNFVLQKNCTAFVLLFIFYSLFMPFFNKHIISGNIKICTAYSTSCTASLHCLIVNVQHLYSPLQRRKVCFKTLIEENRRHCDKSIEAVSSLYRKTLIKKKK